ncbi:MAG: hypothetical protein RI996_95 [Candidatus Parcubacteria bacterium]|jgi:hypothetical protein
MNDDQKITYFGETDFRNARTKFGIKRKDRTRHMYIIGKTGMGKSTLLENMAIQDIQGGEGICFIDPHGSAAEKLLEFVPEHRIKDVIYFAPFDLENPISFNVLEGIDEERKHLIAAGLMNAFKKIWAEAFSGRMEYILGMTLLALLDNPGETLLGVNRMYSDKDYRKKIVENIKDPSVRSFWVDEYAKYSEKFATEATAAIQNKIGQFTANPLIRNLLGQQESSFDFRQAMDQKKILIVNLSKGKMGPDNMRLIGGMVVTKIYLAAMSRADASAKELKALAPFYLYVDEFQNFANESFAEILSESRKYNLALTVANQYIEQMTEEVRGAILGNVGSMIVFRIGATDAEIMEKEFTPFFTAEDLVNLGFTQIYLKLMIDGVGSQPFSATSLDTLPPLEKSFEREIIENSRLMYCKPRAVIEENIANWFAPVKPAHISNNTNSTNGEYKKSYEPRVGKDMMTQDKKAYSLPRTNISQNSIQKPQQSNRDGYTQRNSLQKPINTDKTKEHSNLRNIDRTVVHSESVNRVELPVADMLAKIKNGEVIEVVTKDPKIQQHAENANTHFKKENNKEQTNPRSISLTTLAKEKSPFNSENKNSLKDAIERAMREQKSDSEKREASVQKVEDVSIEKKDTDIHKNTQTMYTNSIETKEVPEDVLRKLLNDI